MKNLKLRAHIKFLNEIHDIVKINLKTGSVETKDYPFNESEYNLLQFSGMTDKNDQDLYEHDLVNICYTSNSGEYIHDCVYSVNITAMGGLEFNFVKLLWLHGGYNQYPLSSTLTERNNSLYTVYANDKYNLIRQDTYVMEVEPKNDYPFNNEKILSFSSRYFKKIGNLLTNPELLIEDKEYD